MPLSTPNIANYTLALQNREQTEQNALKERFRCAWEVAPKAVQVLKEEFGASRVLVFGSLVHRCWFSNTSDIDLAVWGLDSQTHLVAVAKLQDLSSFKVDLVRMERCKPELMRVVLQEGQLL
jgi:uncharacterized protein